MLATGPDPKFRPWNLRRHVVCCHVFPEAPVRQWVLTFPFPLRFLFANYPHALSAVLAVVHRAISTFVIHHSGFTVASNARAGAVTLIQRFGSALNLNVHLHMLFLEGAYTFSGNRRRLAALVPRPRLNLTRFHGVFAPNFKHRKHIVPQRAHSTVERDEPVAPMSWPFSYIPVLHGTGTSCPMDAAP